MPGDSIKAAYRVAMIPTIYLLDGQGRIAFSHVGGAEDLEEKLAREIEKLLPQ